MDTLRKILGWIIVVAAAVTIITVIVLTLFLDGIVRKSITTLGSEITQTPVSVTAVHLALFNGTAKLDGLAIGNPPEYKSPHAFSVGSAAVGLDPLTVFKDKVLIRSVRVEAPEITFEGDPLTGNNLSQIRANIVKVQKSGGPTNAAPGTAGSGKKFEVDDLVITGARVHAILTGMGGRELTLQLPEIRLQDLGRDKEGITATELSYQVLDRIASAAIKAVAAAEAEQVGGQGAGKVRQEIDHLLGK